MSRRQPPLKPLHADASLIPGKLAAFRKLSSEAIQTSLAPGYEHCLKARTDGTILDGHHRVYVLKERGVDVDSLPRDIIERS